jgi:hypothetical protein
MQPAMLLIFPFWLLRSSWKRLAAALAAGVAYWEIAPGVLIGALATTAVAALNKAVGNEGFEFTFRFKYVEVYMHKEGHYYYGWDIDKISAGTY